jgi:hypothetical protein
LVGRTTVITLPLSLNNSTLSRWMQPIVGAKPTINTHTSNPRGMAKAGHTRAVMFPSLLPRPKDVHETSHHQQDPDDQRSDLIAANAVVGSSNLPIKRCSALPPSNDRHKTADDYEQIHHQLH